MTATGVLPPPRPVRPPAQLTLFRSLSEPPVPLCPIDRLHPRPALLRLHPHLTRPCIPALSRLAHVPVHPPLFCRNPQNAEKYRADAETMAVIRQVCLLLIISLYRCCTHIVLLLYCCMSLP